MDIEAIVKKYISRNGWSFSHDGECADAIRAALTELAAGYEAVAQVTKMNSDRLLRKANERIQQLEAGRVPEDSGLEFALEQLVNVCNNNNDACSWSETISAEAALEKLYKRRLAASAQQKKEPRHE